MTSASTHELSSGAQQVAPLTNVYVMMKQLTESSKL